MGFRLLFLVATSIFAFACTGAEAPPLVVDVEFVDDDDDDGIEELRDPLCVRRDTFMTIGGEPLRIDERRYDAFGDLVEHALDVEADGSYRRLEVFRYNDVAQMVNSKRDLDGDGNFDEQDFYDYEEGLLVFFGHDRNYDFFSEYTTLYAFTEDGRPTMVATADDEQSSTNTTERWTYDGNQNLIERRLEDDEGILLNNETFAYVNDELRERRFDSDGDGIINERFTYEQERFAFLYFDDDDDGVSDRSIEHLYDGLSRLRGQNTYQLDSDASILSASTAYFYDGDDPRLLRSEFDLNGDGTFEGVEVFRYDDAGELIFNELDRDGDGVFEYRFSKRVIGERIETRIETRSGSFRSERIIAVDGDSTIERYESYEGERLRNTHILLFVGETLLEVRSDEDNDGAVDHRTLYGQDCE